VIAIQLKILSSLAKKPGQPFSAAEIAKMIEAPDEVETVFKICEHLSLNPDRNFKKLPGKSPFVSKYSLA